MDSLISPKLQYISEYCKNSNTSHKISKFGLLYNAWIDTRSIRQNIIRSPKFPTFLCPYKSLFINDLINIPSGKSLRGKKLILTKNGKFSLDLSMRMFYPFSLMVPDLRKA